MRFSIFLQSNYLKNVTIAERKCNVYLLLVTDYAKADHTFSSVVNELLLSNTTNSSRWLAMKCIRVVPFSFVEFCFFRAAHAYMSAGIRGSN